MPMKNSNDTIGIRTRDLPACSAVPQPTAPPTNCTTDQLRHRVPPLSLNIYTQFHNKFYLCLFFDITVILFPYHQLSKSGIAQSV